MKNVKLSDLGSTDDPMQSRAYRLSSPMAFFWTMILFLIIVGFIAAILFRQGQEAFMHNPGLNGLILGVLVVGIILVFNHVLSLRPEVRWFNSFRVVGDADKVDLNPKLLAPMRALLGSRKSMSLSTATLRSILDSIASRLDESRDISRYLIGLLVFLGLLGTFWGLIGTIGSINKVIQSLDVAEGGDILGTLKESLAAPLVGMGTAFSSSLLGLSGSLILGFLDLQAGRAQSRFYTELENWLSSVTDVGSDMSSVTDATNGASADDVRALSEQMRQIAEEGGSGQRSVAAMANLADGIQGLVKNMRNEQQMLRDWIEAQQEEAKSMRRTLDRLSDRIGSIEKTGSK
ncbi:MULTISPECIES: MotA/TolQ/ExbB proton channel family protein [unclassified Rhizobium]|uniref:MotA/TolQ/ExbB proton channel family protein n=1 Tax=unclassified Rhizobium TaxID=2613769 RepID=UPI001ADA0110|nr:MULTISPECIES: MotA/TolQ/ExbB proton channel family protein [unclassified Rhizobium]MBO9099668.1 MotA/TolQ/ExbB proton channel family protein [Rhizobium sp. L58/93]MBO9131800.1 MotA/TolQ/ExbB proton channel family protein [Rhizobium sp. B209b/85]MBO9169658.1 MotA/TolQ/ExbB proton channel family protein [Rhizobium sp. L245/93]MBO9185616.1 MotA/TolQ/ExbB proton channel family protein [Rhizobium sp. E27B/91]QXZ82383.1 MotA/TolQ/ExbB proton channel family protein [Rhizobium sp. K1/93]